MDNQAISEAIEILINNFTRNPRLGDSTSLESMNVFDMLQEFWQMKLISGNSSATESVNTGSNQQAPSINSSCAAQVVYEFLEKPDPPYICFVTLPNGSCFGTFQNTNTKLEARKSAALISLMNSIFNEHPLRRINEDFVKKSIENAQRDIPNACSMSIDLYKRMLETCLSKTMLEFKQMMTVFQLLQWNGSLRAMRERNCSLEDVISFYGSFKIDESMRYEMSLDWIAREQSQSGLILNELKRVNQDIEEARLRGQEMRFLKEKRDILLLASYQFDMEVNAVC